MNNPSLDGPIQRHANGVKQVLEARGMKQEPHTRSLEKLNKLGRGVHKDDDEVARTDELREELTEEGGVQQGLLQSDRWWITSTVFPLISGAFGPLANLASICALVQAWRVHILPGGAEIHGDPIPDPAWLVANFRIIFAPLNRLLGVNAISLVMAVVANVSILVTFAQRIRYQVSLPITITLWYISSLLLIALVAAALYRLKVHSGQSYSFSQSYYYGILAAVLYFIIATLLSANYFNSTIKKRYSPSFNILTIPQRTLMLQTTSLMFYLGIGALIFSKIEEWEYVDTVYWANYTLLTVGLGTDYPLTHTASKILLIPYAVGGITALGLVVGSVRSLVLERAKVKMNRRAVVKEHRKWVQILKSSRDETSRGSRSANEVIKEEFEVMRKIEKNAEAKGKWAALATSVVAFLIVWLGGAMVFTFSEHLQHWSYFDSLYFSYTSLLTIGYGDYYPQSNSGKPFFVIWSVIAVPTMTILISNMGDTVVLWIREGTLWIGKKTILPESNGEYSSEKSGNAQEAVGEVREALHRPPTHTLKKLASEIRRISEHVGISPPKRYTFDEWIEWIELLELEWESGDWSWLDEGGPLLSELNEPEWLLERLCKKLEQTVGR